MDVNIKENFNNFKQSCFDFIKNKELIEKIQSVAIAAAVAIVAVGACFLLVKGFIALPLLVKIAVLTPTSITNPITALFMCFWACVHASVATTPLAAAGYGTLSTINMLLGIASIRFLERL